VLLQVVIAADVIAGIYLLVHAVRRRRRNKTALMVVAGLLLVCAAALWMIGATTHKTPAERTPARPPSGTPV
jgi:hypothetical protein